MDNQCSVYKTANFAGKRWTILILLELHKGRENWKRYSELKKKLLNITPKILSLRLKELQKEGLIKRKVKIKKLPVQSYYRLTKKGGEFVSVIRLIKKWSSRWIKQNNQLCSLVECKSCKR